MSDNPLEVVVDTRLPVGEVDETTYLEVLADCVRVMRESGIPHAFIGGLASTIYGRERHTHDLDLFVRPDDAERALEVLAAAGYQTERVEPRLDLQGDQAGPSGRRHLHGHRRRSLR